MKTLRLALVRTSLILFYCSAVFAFALAPSLVINIARAQEDDLLPGLVTTLTDQDERSIQRIDRDAVFDRIDVQQTAIDSSGLLEVLGKGEYAFAVWANGKGSVKIDDEVVLDFESRDIQWHFSEPIELSFGLHDIQIEYASAGNSAIFKLFWQGKKFRWEPIQSQFLYHETHDESIDQFARGKRLAHALKCAACHSPEGKGNVARPSLAPDLSNLAGNIKPAWLTKWLIDHGKSDEEKGESSQTDSRMMPFYSLNEKQVEAIAAYLMDASKGRENEPRLNSKYTSSFQNSGRELFLTTGCIACHQYETLGKANLFDGGNLTTIADKRPAKFFETWLEQPANHNKNHRMPVFDLDGDEVRDLAAFLSSLSSGDEQFETDEIPEPDDEDEHRRLISLGERQFKMLGCAKCHEESEPTIALSFEADDAHWKSSCLEQTSRPAQPLYRLSEKQKTSLKTYFGSLASSGLRKPTRNHSPEMLLAENNCLACHSRNGSAGLQQNLTDIASYDAELAASISVMTPPSLTSVGDKFTEKNLVAAITTPNNKYRDWLKVRMPKFKFDDKQVKLLAKHFIGHDHIPKLPQDRAPKLITDLDSKKMTFSAPSLVTANGFSCTSCHQIGSQVPADAPANARGPDLSMIKDRIRHEWFNRWLHDPARIVPGMEMPSVQSPVRGYFDDDVDQQIAAVWKLINKKGFEPPIPQPIRILARSGKQADNERALTLVDVVSDHSQNFVKPIVIGLPNRQNILFDFETGRLVRWWTGDMLAQQNRGKTWFWEPAGETVLKNESKASDFRLIHPDYKEAPAKSGQFVSEPDLWTVKNDGSVTVSHRLRFASKSDGKDAVLNVTQTFSPIWDQQFGFKRSLKIDRMPKGSSLQVSHVYQNGKAFTGPETMKFDPAISIINAKNGSGNGSIPYVATQQSDEPENKIGSAISQKNDTLKTPPKSQNKLQPLNIVPGFESIRLPTTRDMMATAIAWRPDGKMLVADLKGRIWLVDDSNGDGIEDRATVISEELATPYGISATDDYIDVSTKFAIVRMTDEDADGHYETNKIVASGWGHTDDYHDWIVGLPKSPRGGYYIGIPCQQDDRSDAAAKHRGRFLELVPRKPTDENPLLFDIKQLSSGHRFPMGIAVNSNDQIFVTDNQGNYNPFNELNHVRPDAFFGFVNRNEKNDEKINSRSVDAPAIDIPHPWTRSVNGITFLEIPNEPELTKKAFGPFAGHLIGAEYDSKRVIRMSIEQVGDTIQGAAYPFSLEPADSKSSEAKLTEAMLGPIEVAVSPRGDIVVGSMREAGWGAGNNVGELIRIRPKLDELPTGIAELKLVSDGFEIQFTHPIDSKLAADAENYVVVSYTRTSTPKYGGDDEQRRVEKVRAVTVADDHKSVRVSLNNLRENFVYELRLKKLIKSGEFFPSEAFYTLRKKR